MTIRSKQVGLGIVEQTAWLGIHGQKGGDFTDKGDQLIRNETFSVIGKNDCIGFFGLGPQSFSQLVEIGFIGLRSFLPVDPADLLIGCHHPGFADSGSTSKA